MSTFRALLFCYLSFDLSSVAPANRNETTWLVSRVPPLSYRAYHSQLKSSCRSLTEADRLHASGNDDLLPSLNIVSDSKRTL